MIHPARRIALVAAMSLAIGVGTVAPAFAKEGDGTTSTTRADGASTTRAPERPTTTRAPERPSTTRAQESTSVKPPAPPSTPATTIERPSTTRAKGAPVGPLLEQLVVRVQASKLDDATKTALIARLTEMKAAAAAGTIDTPVMAQLIRDINTALGRPTEDHPTSVPGSPTTTDHDDDEHTSTSKPPKPPKPVDRVGVLALILKASAKVKDSALPDADKAALLEQLAAVKAKAEAGTLAGTEDLGKVLNAVREALSKVVRPEVEDKDASGTSTSRPERKGTSMERALAAIDEQIVKIKASALSDDVKASAIEALNNVKTQIAAGVKPGDDKPGDVSDHIKEHKAKRLGEMVAKLSALADRIDAKADEVAVLPNSADAVALAKSNVAKARDLLALAATPEDLRAAYRLLKEAKMALHAVLEANEDPATTTTVPAPVTTVVVEPTTTIAEVVESTTTLPTIG
jgi:hypothetical protein